VTNVSTTHALDEVAARHGSRVRRTRVGEANVAEGMRRHQAVIGGEGNGGVIYPAINFARDSLVGIALVLHLLAERGEPISAVTAALPACEMAKYRLPCPSHRIIEVLRRVREEYGRRFGVNLQDGVKVTMPDGWFLLRGSNTEPVLRLVAEAKTQSDAARIGDDVLSRVRSWIAGPG